MVKYTTMRTLTKIFKALSDTTRLRILKMLEVRALYVCEVTEVLKVSTAAVSRHLTLLRNAGLIIDQKEGRWVKYALNTQLSDEYVQHLLPLLRKWLPDNQTILNDKKRIREISRETICKT